MNRLVERSSGRCSINGRGELADGRRSVACACRSRRRRLCAYVCRRAARCACGGRRHAHSLVRIAAAVIATRRLSLDRRYGWWVHDSLMWCRSRERLSGFVVGRIELVEYGVGRILLLSSQSGSRGSRVVQFNLNHVVCLLFVLRWVLRHR